MKTLFDTRPLGPHRGGAFNTPFVSPDVHSTGVAVNVTEHGLMVAVFIRFMESNVWCFYDTMTSQQACELRDALCQEYGPPK